MLTTKNRSSHALTRQKLRGIAFMSCATFLFAVAHLIARLISGRYPVNEVTFFRMLFGLIPAAFLLRLHSGQWKELTARRFIRHCLRAVTVLGAVGSFFAGLPYLPLSTAVTLKYTDVIFIGLFAIVFLGERFRLTTGIATISGFIGVTMVSFSPTRSDAPMLAIFLILLSAMFNAGSVIQIKKLSLSDEPTEIVLYFTIIATIVSGISLSFAWTTPGLTDLGYMVLLGVTAGVGQLMLTIAVASTTTSFLAPFSYFGVVWSIIFDYLIWGESISLQAVLGSVIIIASALYLSCRA
ncbi:DMT family transporter [Paraburkholderia sp. BL9I2N2]|uniref:DMT family transporter n=1 Tax=Paraburkholderia sp. BL9I2N2 TaxID=1938809 RepID=UPI00104C539D|nr:DMT family transporter [Paraburkholderia sp. BL9I2N2]